MDAEQKLTALKKAYADILFNMSKESAARVMLSERKAVKFEHELKLAKEDGVRMLVRLKQMMDYKVGEAEAAASNQQNKIEELEAQLHEAEDIVRDLREELRETQAELERAKSEISKLVGNKFHSYQPSPFVRPRPQDISPVAADVTIPHASQEIEHQRCSNKAVGICSSYIGPRDLPSIILRRKGCGLYRNGCTQRIRACERNLLEKEQCLSGKVDKVKDSENDRVRGDGKDTGKGPAKSLSELEKKLLEGIEFDGSESFHQRKKRTTGQRKPLRNSGGKQSVFLAEMDQLPEVPIITDSISVKASADFGEDLSKIASGFSEDKDEQKIQTEGEKSCEKEINRLGINGVKNVHRNVIQDVVPVIDGIGFADGGSDGEMEIEKVNVPIDNSLKNTSVVPVNDSIGFVDGVSDGEMEIEKVNVPLDNSQKNTSEMTENIRIGEKVIKFTFQRKRKRLTLNESDMNSALETVRKSGEKPNGHQKVEILSPETENESEDKSNGHQKPENLIIVTEKKLGDKSNAHRKPEPPLSSLFKESRDSRRMVQVARQLIALSENKRWL